MNLVMAGGVQSSTSSQPAKINSIKLIPKQGKIRIVILKYMGFIITGPFRLCVVNGFLLIHSLGIGFLGKYLCKQRNCAIVMQLLNSLDLENYRSTNCNKNGS